MLGGGGRADDKEGETRIFGYPHTRVNVLCPTKEKQ